jgi:hypothetical protein
VESDEGLVYTKTFSDNFTGEQVFFTPEGDTNTETALLSVTRILPEASISYDPAGPTLTTEPIVSTISFTKS